MEEKRVFSPRTSRLNPSLHHHPHSPLLCRFRPALASASSQFEHRKAAIHCKPNPDHVASLFLSADSNRSTATVISTCQPSAVPTSLSPFSPSLLLSSFRRLIIDPTEFADYRLRKRKEYEDVIKRIRWNISVWGKYTQLEESLKDFARSRSVWERALEEICESNSYENIAKIKLTVDFFPVIEKN
ncbi:Crooked neck-like protein 1 [Carex littledalei]|uniref:Crooked neck-like protein 1 n=1 Tax=Carex littledalei TaxID=544730 RepID=A0A833VC70_9POAL|nr:Crooked neck-like protein 1 [Carex littledalei]